MAATSLYYQHFIDQINATTEITVGKSTQELRTELKKGFSEFISQSDDLNKSLIKLYNITERGLSEIVDQLIIVNVYLGKIEMLLRIPEKQKDRAYFIEKGLMAYSNAVIPEDPNDRHYVEAQGHFNNAIEIESDDFFSLYYIGKILLKTRFYDPLKAEAVLLESAYHYLEQAKVGGTTVSRGLLPNINFWLGAANAYIEAAYACFLQGKYSKAVQHAREAWQTVPDFTKAGLMLSKYLHLNGKQEESHKVLREVITQNRIYFEYTQNEKYLKEQADIQALLEELRIQANAETTNELNYCVNNAVKNSEAISYLPLIRDTYRSGEFLKAKEAMDMLLTSREWQTQDGALFNSDRQVLPEIGSIKYTGSVIDLVVYERKSELAIPLANILINIKATEEIRKTCLSKIPALKTEVGRLKNLREVSRFVAGAVLIFGLYYKINGRDSLSFFWGMVLIPAVIIFIWQEISFLEANSKYRAKNETLAVANKTLTELEWEREQEAKKITAALFLN